MHRLIEDLCQSLLLRTEIIDCAKGEAGDGGEVFHFMPPWLSVSIAIKLAAPRLSMPSFG